MRCASFLSTLAAALAMLSTSRSGRADIITGFEPGDVPWQTCQSVSTVGSLGIVAPTQGSYQALIQTRQSYDDAAVASFLNVPNDSALGLLDQMYFGASAIKHDLTVPAGALLQFDMNMLTQETGLQGGEFPDAAFLTVGLGGQQATVLQLLAVPMLGTDANHVADPWTTPTGSGFLRQSGYATYNYTFAAAGTYTVGFMVANKGDDLAQSAITLDNIQLTTTETAAAPEPASMALLAAGGAALLMRRRSARRRC